MKRRSSSPQWTKTTLTISTEQEDGYETHLVDFPYDQGARLTDYLLNITLGNGSCHSDCSGFVYEDGRSYCQPACAGYTGTDGNTCSFDENFDGTTINPLFNSLYNLSSECAGKQLGAWVVLQSVGSESLMVQCCDNAPVQQTRPVVELQQAGITDLIQQTLVAELEGEASLVKVRIVVYNK